MVNKYRLLNMLSIKPNVSLRKTLFKVFKKYSHGFKNQTQNGNEHRNGRKSGSEAGGMPEGV